MKTSSIPKIIEMVGGQKKLGMLIGVSQQTVSHWLVNEAEIPAEKAVDLEKVTKGQIPRWMSRPDLWDAPRNKRTPARR
jgi:DNA-binding transcriptional regulator YdaS (Cro superfamily)